MIASRGEVYLSKGALSRATPRTILRPMREVSDLQDLPDGARRLVLEKPRKKEKPTPGTPGITLWPRFPG